MVIGLCVCPIFANNASGQVIKIIQQADFMMSEATVPPSDSEQWKSVKLTHRWKAEDYQLGRNAWYRLSFKLNEIPSEPIGIYIRRFNMNAAIYINDYFLKDGGSFEEPLSRNWNRPLYSSIPSVVLTKGVNTIYIRLKSYPRFAYISPVALGEASILSSEYDLQSTLQIGIGRAVFPMTVAMAIFILGLWARRRNDSKYLWFSLALLSWSVYSLNMIVVDLWVPTKIWEWFAHSCVDWWVILLTIFAHRFIDKSFPRLEKLYIAFGVISSLSYLFLEHENMAVATFVFHAMSIIIGFVTTSILFRDAFIRKNRSYYMLAIGLLILLLSGINDWLFQTSLSGVAGRLTIHLHHYAAPIVFLFMAWHLSGRFIAALNEVELLNVDLENRVEHARVKIEQHFLDSAEHQKKQTISVERERLSREIHDGLSGNIANSLMLTELLSSQENSDNKDERSRFQSRITQLKNQLQEGLNEVRNLMLTMENDVATLDDLSVHIVSKYQELLLPEINFKSTVELENGRQPIRHKIALNILRMTQEILNNIKAHASATEVKLSIKYTNKLLTLIIEDNGGGFDMKEQQQGHYGLSNLKKRCLDIGAELDISSSQDSGCKIILQLPV